MNNKFGKAAAWTTACAAAIFAIAMLIPDKHISNMLSFGICIVLSWGYVGLACAFAAMTPHERKVFAYTGLAFAVIYSVFIHLVYFTQLSTVNAQAASPDILKALDYQSGGWMFSLDLLGYGTLSISTVFLGLTLKPKKASEKWLKSLLLIHGVFAPSSLLMPVLNVFGNMGSVGAGSEASDIGILILEFWCVFFIPIMLLAANYFKTSKDTETK